MRDNTGLFACPATMEVGKLIGEARDEVNLSGDLIEYHATNAERFLATQKQTPSSGEAGREQSPGRFAWRTAVEFPLLSACPLCRS